jgi:hypothetical protein
MEREETVRIQGRMRAQRHRNAKSNAKSNEVSRCIYQKSEIREEKEAQAPFIFPAWIPEKEWAEFVANRKRKRAVTTDSISARIVGVLDRLKNAGYDPAAVLTKAVDRNWTSIEYDWIAGNKKQSGGGFVG